MGSFNIPVGDGKTSNQLLLKLFNTLVIWLADRPIAASRYNRKTFLVIKVVVSK